MRFGAALMNLIERISGRRAARDRDAGMDEMRREAARLAAVLRLTDWEIERIRRDAQR